MDGGIGTAYEVGEDGLFTGEIGGTFMYGEGKVEAMRRFADQHDIDRVKIPYEGKRRLPHRHAFGRRRRLQPA